MADNENLSRKERCKLCCKYHWHGIVVVLTPLIFIPILFLKPMKAMRCLYVLCVMATYWVTEAIPIYVTSLIPIVAMPALGILSSNETCSQYMKDIIMFFIASMIIAMAVEFTNLHTRLALAVISIVGCSPRRLHFSMMAVTYFVSCWLSNSASTAMLCPIVKAILEQLDEQGIIKFNKDKEPLSEDDFQYPSNVTVSFFLGIAYAASIGGNTTLIGSGTSLGIKGIYEERFPNGAPLTFNQFFYFNLPAVLIIFALTFIWLEVLLMGLFRPNSEIAKELHIGEEGKKTAMNIIKQKRMELGPMTTVQMITGFYFVLMVLLLFFKSPDFMTGYADIMNEKQIKSSAPTLIITFFLFATPASFVFCRYFGCKKPENDKKVDSIMTWSYVQKNYPWGVPLVFGGGFALSKGMKQSKLTAFIGGNLKALTHLPLPIIQFCCILSALFLTAFTSNLVTATILLPIVMEIALISEIHPLYLALPAGVSCSLAFHLPVSTPPNAIAAGLVHIRTKDMAIAGIGPTLFSLFIYFALSQFWGPVVIDGFTGFPGWARAHKVPQSFANFTNGI